MKPLLFCLTLFSGLLLFPLSSDAQIVNIEDRRHDRADTVAWYGGLNLGFNLVENGDAIYTFNGGLTIEHLRHRHLWLAFSRFNLVRVDAQDFINDGFQHLRYNYKFNDRLTWEAFGQVQYNERIRLQFRGLLGAGPRWALLREKNKQRIYLGVLYMYEYNEDKLTNAEGDAFIEYLRDHRMSSYLAFRLQLTDNTVLSSTSYYQPVLNNFADLRLSSQTNLQIGITEKLKFTTNFSILYDSRVPETVPNTTYRWVNGIQWNW